MTFLIFLAFFMTVAQDGGQWKEKLSKKDIVVYTRNSERTKYKEFLALTTMSGTLEKFKKFITDVENYPEWVPDCKSIEIIEKNSPVDITYHMILGISYPFKDRDIVQQLQLTEMPGYTEVKITNHPKKIPDRKKYTRMPIADGTWQVKELSGGKISIRFQYLADPGGKIPAWLANAFIVDSPYKTLLNLKKKMEEE